MPTTPTVPPPSADSLHSALKRNIEQLAERRKRDLAASSLQERVADRITGFTGSMLFVCLHLVIYTLWIVINLGWVPGVRRFDPSFVILAMEASVEAIFLSTFVLISQNRMAATADKRADLDLHINLLAEHELTKLTEMVAAISEKLGVHAVPGREIDEISRDVAPEAVLDAIEASNEDQDLRR
ncbi:DUF1003 domain-containing protein [Acidisoma sp.]|uniref:DUF1003 domain-containing protein n=1 Tax=Acidisoma sp. TaxID=1872115 RepID=UPI003B00E5BD